MINLSDLKITKWIQLQTSSNWLELPWNRFESAWIFSNKNAKSLGNFAQIVRK